MIFLLLLVHLALSILLQGFVDTANHHGAQTVDINLMPADRHSQFQYHLQGKASEVLPKLVEQILQGKVVNDQLQAG